MTSAGAGARMPGWLWLLGGLTAIAPLSIDMYLPAFPSIALALDTSRGNVERSLPLFLAGLALGQLIYGPLSDRLGRRPPLLAGLAIYIVGSLACALTSDIGHLTLWRFVQALGGGAGLVIARAVIRDRFDLQASARAISSLMLIMGVAPILAPLAGGWMLMLASWRGIFIAQAAFGLLLLLGCALGLGESRRPPSAGSTAPSIRPWQVLRLYGRLLRDRSLVLPALCGGLAMAGMFAYIAGSPFILIGLYGVEERHYGLIFGLNAFGLIAASQFNGRWLRTFTPLHILRRTLWLPAVAGVGLLLISLRGPPPLPLLMLGLFFYVAGLGTISPNTGAIAMAGQGPQACLASSLLGTLSYAAGMAAGLVLSLFKDAGVLPLTSVMAVCGVSALLLGWPILRRAEVCVLSPVPVIDPPA